VDMEMSCVLSRRLRILGTTLRARPLEEKIEVNNVFQRSLLPLIAGGALKPVVDKVFPIGMASQAHHYVESNESFGKVVLSVPG
jgi:NADPH2:quinone reductase